MADGEPEHLKPKSPAALALGLALMALLGTVALAVLVWLRLSIVSTRTVPFLVPLWIFNLAFFPSAFQSARAVLLSFNVACGLGALWLALRHPK